MKYSRKAPFSFHDSPIFSPFAELKTSPLLRTFFKVALITAFLLISSACSSRNKSKEDSFSEASLKANVLVQRYGQLVGQPQREYLSMLEAALRNSLPDKFDKSMQFKIILLDSGKPFAYSPGAGYILISRGIIEALTKEAELAFLISHEMAHYYLGHSFDELSEEAQMDRDQELAADRMALGIMAFAGYDPRAAIYALGNVYRKANPYLATSETHPDYTSRLYAIQAELRKSGWSQSGLDDRRDFRKFKLSLQRSNY